MVEESDKRELLVAPGHVVLPEAPARLWAVLGSSVAVTLFSPRHARGGMCHFVAPRRNGSSTPRSAAPAIVSLTRMLQSLGAQAGELHATVSGGALNPSAQGFVAGLAEENGAVALEILSKLGVPVTERDVGGTQGRKVVFDSHGGALLVVKVDRLRAGDWYPGTAAAGGGA